MAFSSLLPQDGNLPLIPEAFYCSFTPAQRPLHREADFFREDPVTEHYPPATKAARIASVMNVILLGFPLAEHRPCDLHLSVSDPVDELMKIRRRAGMVRNDLELVPDGKFEPGRGGNVEG
jgi:hypothetical protein